MGVEASSSAKATVRARVERGRRRRRLDRAAPLSVGMGLTGTCVAGLSLAAFLAEPELQLPYPGLQAVTAANQAERPTYPEHGLPDAVIGEAARATALADTADRADPEAELEIAHTAEGEEEPKEEANGI